MITNSQPSTFMPVRVGSSSTDGRNVAARVVNRVWSCVKSAHNSPYLLEKFNTDVMHKIAGFCSVKDVVNMAKGNLHPEMKLVYHHTIFAKYHGMFADLHKWKESPEGGLAEGENRNLAVKQILDCIIEEKNKLDLSNLGLKSLPNLRPLNFLTNLNWEGNDPTVIENCFEIVNSHRFRLKDSASLPDAIDEITMNTEARDRSDGNERVDPRVLSYEDTRIRTVHIIKTPEDLVDGSFVLCPPGRENARFLSLPLLVPLNSHFGWDYLGWGR